MALVSKRNVIRIGLPLAKLSGSAHEPGERHLVKLLHLRINLIFVAIGMVSVDYNVPRRLILALFLLLYTAWQPSSCDYPLVNN